MLVAAAPDLHSGAPLVPVVQAAKLGQGDDLGATSWPNLSRATCRRGLVERQVAAVVVIVGDVVPEQTKQAAVIDDHDAVEELAASAADPAFGHRSAKGSVAAVRLGFMPRDFTVEITCAEKVASRSNTR